MKKYLALVVLPGVLFFIISCQKDSLDLNKKSNYYDIEREVSIPLVNGNISFQNLLNVTPDTLEILNLLDTLDVYYDLEYDHSDTINLAKINKNIQIISAKMYYWFTNEFPVGLDSKILMLDTIHSEIIDSILLNSTPGEVFLLPAPVDAEGVVIDDSVKEVAGFMNIDSVQANNLVQRTNKLILFSRVYANTLSIVKVKHTSSLKFKFSLNVDGKFDGYYTPNN